MMNIRTRYQQRILLIAEEPNEKKIIASNDVFKLHHRVDEAVIAISRASFSAGVGVCIPYDSKFASLIIQLAAEYIAPRYAEGGKPVHLNEKDDSVHYAVRLLDLGEKKVTNNQLRYDQAIILFENMGVVSKQAVSFKELIEVNRPKALVLIGSGNKSKWVLKETEHAQIDLPICAFRTCEESGYQSDKKIRYFDEEIIPKLAELRNELKPIKTDDEKWPHHEEDLHKEKRFSYTPYSLIAQRMLLQLGIIEKGLFL